MTGFVLLDPVLKSTEYLQQSDGGALLSCGIHLAVVGMSRQLAVDGW